MAHYSANYRTLKKTPVATSVTQPIPGRESIMEANNGGGMSFTADKWFLLERALIIGSAGGSYYVDEKTLTERNAQVILDCLAEDGKKVVNLIVDISDKGRALKNDHAIFALALATSPSLANIETRSLAWNALSKVCRIGTHLFLFNQIADQHRRWGHARRNAMTRWYESKDPHALSLQIVKYQGRITSEGDKSSRWSHCDVLRKAHPFSKDPLHNAIYDYATHAWAQPIGENAEKVRLVSEETRNLIQTDKNLRLILGHQLAQTATSASQVVALINEYNIPHESIPTQFKSDADVWRALLSHLPLHALLRSLGRMTSYGILDKMSEESQYIIDRLKDQAYIKKGRMHPLAVLIAMKIYEQGHGEKGKLIWTPNQSIVSALQDAFYASFGAIEPTGKNLLIGLDVSGSMSGGGCAGLDNFSYAEGTAAMAMATAKIENENSYEIIGFADTTRSLGISPRMDLTEVMNKIMGLSFSSTNPAAAVEYALNKKMMIDAFIIYSDGEANFGDHIQQTLENYRKKMNPKAKMICVNMIANKTRLSDPNDSLCLEVTGFDEETPTIISSFVRL